MKKKPLQNEAFSSVSLFLHPERLKLAIEIINGSKSTCFSPVCTEIRPTNRCNKKCSWCFTSSREIKRSINPHLLNQVITNLYHSGTKNIHFSGGGEPTLCEGLSILRKLKEDLSNITFGLISNGVGYSLSLAKYIAETFDWVRLSLTGDSQNIPCNNCLEDQLKSLSNILESVGNKTINIGVSYILEDNNKFNLSNLSQILKISGLSYVQIKQLFESNWNDKYYSQIKEHLENINQRPSIHFFYPLPKPTGFSYCYYGLLSNVIGADGHVYPCCFSESIKRDFGPIESFLGRPMISATYWDKIKRIDIEKCRYCRHIHFNKIIELLVNVREKDAHALIDSIADGSIAESRRLILLFKSMPSLPSEFFNELISVPALAHESTLNKSLLFPVYRECEILPCVSRG